MKVNPISFFNKIKSRVASDLFDVRDSFYKCTAENEDLKGLTGVAGVPG